MRLELLHDWKDQTLENMMSDFQGSRYGDSEDESKEQYVDKTVRGADWLFGSYTYENYSGDAFVLFKKDGEIFEINGSHCSCYGLERDWSPEKTTIEAIKERLKNGLGKSGWNENEFNQALIEFLKEVE